MNKKFKIKYKFLLGFFPDLSSCYEDVLSEEDMKKLDKFPINLKIMKASEEMSINEYY